MAGGAVLFGSMTFGELRRALARLPVYASQNRQRIRLLAESFTFCVLTGGLGWLAYEIRETALAIERCVQKDPMLLNYKAPEYVFVDKAAFTGRFRFFALSGAPTSNVFSYYLLYTPLYTILAINFDDSIRSCTNVTH